MGIRDQHERIRTRSQSRNRSLHARRRFYERYGVQMSKDAFKRIEKSIGSPGTHRMFRQDGCSMEHWLVKYKGMWVRLTYDCMRKEIASFLDPPSAETAQWAENRERQRLEAPRGKSRRSLADLVKEAQKRKS